MPEFYGERETLYDVPHLEGGRIEGNQTLASFTRIPTVARHAAIVQPSENSPSVKLRAQGFNLVGDRSAAGAHFHSWTHYAWQAQEMWPDMYAQIHPKTAAEVGVEDGDG